MTESLSGTDTCGGGEGSREREVRREQRDGRRGGGWQQREKIGREATRELAAEKVGREVAAWGVAVECREEAEARGPSAGRCKAGWVRGWVKGGWGSAVQPAGLCVAASPGAGKWRLRC